MYQYLDRKPQAGDIVECQIDIIAFTKGKLYISKGIHPNYDESIAVALDDKGSTTNGLPYTYFTVVKTLPGDHAKVGNTCIRIGDSANNQYNGSKKGDIFNVTHMAGVCVGYKKDFSMHPDNAKVLCLAEAKPKAYYKSSGEPWTIEELQQIPNYWKTNYTTFNSDAFHYQFSYPNIANEYCMWPEQKPEDYPKNYTLVAFEDEFNISQLGAQSEPTQSIIKEQSMNFQQLINSIFQEEIQTDYDKKPNFLVVIYNNEGTEIAQATAGSIKQVEDKIQSTPKLWGAKAVIYSIDSEVQTAVPVTTTKLKKSK